MKNTSTYKWLPLISSILSMLVGIVVFVLTIVDCIRNGVNDNPTFAGVGIAYTLAISLFIIGIICTIVSMTTEINELFSKNLIIAVATIALGLFFILCANEMGKFIVQILACLLMIAGALALIKGILQIVAKKPVGIIIGAFVIAAIGITVGILSLAPGTSNTMGIIIFFIIALLILGGGIASLIAAIKGMQKPEAE